MKLKSSDSKGTKQVASTTAAPSKVDGIIKALSGLESDIDSLNQNLAEMKKELNQKAQHEIDRLKEQVVQMATKEAESIISQAREKAQAEGQRISTAGDVNLKDVQDKIDANFNKAVDNVVSTVLKA